MLFRRHLLDQPGRCFSFVQLHRESSVGWSLLDAPVVLGRVWLNKRIEPMTRSAVTFFLMLVLAGALLVMAHPDRWVKESAYGREREEAV